MASLGEVKIFIHLSGSAFSVCFLDGAEGAWEITEAKSFAFEDLASMADLLALSGIPRVSGFYMALCTADLDNNFFTFFQNDGVGHFRDSLARNIVIKNHHQIDPEDFTIRFLNPQNGSSIVSEEYDAKVMLACGGLTSEIESFQNTLLEKSVYPARIELASLSVLAECLDFTQDSGEVILILETFFESSRAIIIQNKEVLFTQDIKFGVDQIYEDIRSRIGLDTVEEVRTIVNASTMDLSAIGYDIFQPLIDEMRGVIDNFELKVGTSVSSFLQLGIPRSFTWASSLIEDRLNVKALPFELTEWLKSYNITFAGDIQQARLDESWLPILSQMVTYTKLYSQD